MFTAAPPAPPDDDRNKPAAGDAGQRQRDRAAARSRANSARVAEIGPPPPRNEKRWKRYQFDLFRYLVECFPESTGLKPFSLDHKRIIERTQQTILEGGQDLIIVFRGFAKSTITENATTWAAGYGHRVFFVPIAATDDMAKTALDSIQYEFETNANLFEIFPAACHAARALEGIQQRAGKQSINGERTYIEWSKNRCVLPTFPGFEGSGAIIWPKGITSNIRGLRFKRPDGTQARPDFVMGDDLQTDASAASPNQCTKRLNALTKTIMRLGGHTTSLGVIVNATKIEPDDAIDQLSNAKKFPSWRSTAVPMMKSFSKVHETDWLVTYAELRTNFDREDPDDRQRAHKEATAYYKKNRKRMDAGAAATWEHCFDPKHEISAIQHAYNILIDTGQDAFDAECQNTPAKETSALKILTVEEICAKQSGYPMGKFPPECTRLTAFIDVHPSILYWHVWAWAPGFTGYMIENETFPQQRRRNFAHRSIAISLQELYPGRDDEATVFAGLNALLHGDPKLERYADWPGLMRREWIRTDGVPLRIGFGLIDANGVMAATVKSVIRQSPFAAILSPSFGKGVGAKTAPMSRWPQSREQKGVGPEWVLTKAQAGEPPGTLFDTNFWKTKFFRGLALPQGSQGALMLHKAEKPGDHTRVGNAWNAETAKLVTVGSREVFEFAQKPNTDNHDLDCAVGAMVAASRGGIASLTPKPAKPKKGRKKVKYL